MEKAAAITYGTTIAGLLLLHRTITKEGEGACIGRSLPAGREMLKMLRKGKKKITNRIEEGCAL